MMGSGVSQESHTLKVAFFVEELLSYQFYITLEVGNVGAEVLLRLLLGLGSQGLHENFRHIML